MQPLRSCVICLLHHLGTGLYLVYVISHQFLSFVELIVSLNEFNVYSRDGPSRPQMDNVLLAGMGNVEIAALTARQVMGATSFSGTPDNPILFLKETSPNGNFQTADAIFPSFPFFLYADPRWLAYLLEPILEYTLSGQYPNKHALHDIRRTLPKCNWPS